MKQNTRLTFFKTRFARYKKVKLVKCPISRHILAKNKKFTSKMISHSFESLTIEQITNVLWLHVKVCLHWMILWCWSHRNMGYKGF